VTSWSRCSIPSIMGVTLSICCRGPAPSVGKGFRNSVDRVTWPPCGMEPCLVSCRGVFRVVSQGTTGGGLAHRSSSRQQRRSSPLSSRSTVSMKQILQGNPLRGLATVSQDRNCHWSTVTSNHGFGQVVDQDVRRLCETVARLLRGLSGLLGVAMSPIKPSLAGRRDATGSGSSRGRHRTAIANRRRLPQLHPLSDRIHANRSAASVTRSLRGTSVPSLTSPYHRQLRNIPRHTHLQPVADRSRRC
jgi:hypothetical protein